MGALTVNSLIGSNGNLRQATTFIRTRILDNRYDRQGIDVAIDGAPEKPAFLYLNAPTDIRWLPNRSANSYRLERTSDGTTWSTIAEMNAGAADPGMTGVCSYSDSNAELNNYYTYRVVAVTDQGEIVSDPSVTVFVPKITCDEDENLCSTTALKKAVRPVGSTG